MLPLNVFLNITFTPGPWVEPCWIWTKGSTNGYGMVRHNGKMVYVHCLVYELLVGPIPKGYVMVCSCSRSCCNPKHWKPFTRVEAAKLRSKWGSEPKELKLRALKKKIKKLKRQAEELRRGLGITDEDFCA